MSTRALRRRVSLVGITPANASSMSVNVASFTLGAPGVEGGDII